VFGLGVSKSFRDSSLIFTVTPSAFGTSPKYDNLWFECVTLTRFSVLFSALLLCPLKRVKISRFNVPIVGFGGGWVGVERWEKVLSPSGMLRDPRWG
jgi:hypothetical protein